MLNHLLGRVDPQDMCGTWSGREQAFFGIIPSRPQPEESLQVQFPLDLQLSLGQGGLACRHLCEASGEAGSVGFCSMSPNQQRKWVSTPMSLSLFCTHLPQIRGEACYPHGHCSPAPQQRLLGAKEAGNRQDGPWESHPTLLITIPQQE